MRALLYLALGAGLAHLVTRLRDRAVARRSDHPAPSEWRHIFRGGTRL